MSRLEQARGGRASGRAARWEAELQPGSGRNQMARSKPVMSQRRREGSFKGEALCNRVVRVGDNPQGQGRHIGEPFLSLACWGERRAW